MAANPRISWPPLVLRGLVAGLAGVVVHDLYLWATTLLPLHDSLGTHWQWVASTVLGRPAAADPRSAPAGAALDALVGIGWACGYAYIAAVNPLANRRWGISGIVYGLIVYTIMQTILLADGNFTYPPNPNAFVNALAAHALFFGVPVAYVVRATQRPSAS